MTQLLLGAEAGAVDGPLEFRPDSVGTAGPGRLPNALAGRPGGFLAPIRGLGTVRDADPALCGLGVWVARPRFPIAAADFVRGRVAMQSHVLWEVVSGVLEALSPLHIGAGRPHGRLTPRRVLIDDSAGYGSLRVGLDGPERDEDLSLDRARDLLDDLHAVGRLIHALVLHRPFRVLGGYPIADGPAWRALWKRGPAWLDLTNRLLDPKARPGTLTLEEVSREVAALRIGQRRPTKQFALAAGLSLCLLGGGGAVLAARAPEAREQIEFAALDPVLFERWCLESHAWFATFNAEYARLEPALRADAGLDRAVGALMDEAARRNLLLDPRDAAEEEVRSSLDLPERIKFGLSVREERLGGRTNAAVRIMDEVRAGIESWDGPDRLEQSARALDAIGWPDLAGVARDAAADLAVENRRQRPDANGTRGIAWFLARAVRVIDAADRVRAAWADLNAAARGLAEAGSSGRQFPDLEPEDPMLTGFAAAARAAIAEATSDVDDGDSPLAGAVPTAGGRFKRAEAALAAWRAESERLAAFARSGWLDVDRAHFHAQSESLALVREHEEPAGLDEYRHWLAEASAERFEIPDPALDPRVGWAGPERLAELAATAQEYRVNSEYRIFAEPAFAAENARLGVGRDIERELAVAADETRDLLPLPWRRATRERIIDRHRRLVDRIAELETAMYRVSSTVVVDETAFVAAARARGGVSRSGLPSLDSAWRASRDVLLGAYDRDADFPTLRLGIERLEEALSSLERAVLGAGDLARWHDAFSGSERPPVLDAAAAADALQLRRDAAAEIAATRLAAGIAGAESEPDEPAALERAAAAAVASWIDDALAAADLVLRVGDLLDRAYLPGEPSATGERIETLRGGVSDFLESDGSRGAGDTRHGSGPGERAEIAPRPPFQEALARAFEPVLGPARRLDRIRATRSTGDLLEMLRSTPDSARAGEAAVGTRSARRAAYLTLTAADPSWPGPAEIERDAAAGDALARSLATIADAARRESLLNSTRLERAARWSHAAAAARTTEDAALVAGVGLSLLDAGVLEEPRLKPAEAYNLDLHRFAERAASDLDRVTREEVEALAARLQTLAGPSGGLGPKTEAGTPHAPSRLAPDRVWLSRLAAAGREPDAQEPELDPRRIGPGLAGWRLLNIEEVERLTYAWPPEGEPRLTLSFVLLDPEVIDGVSQAAYLGVEEVSVAVAARALVGTADTPPDRRPWQDLADPGVWVQLAALAGARPADDGLAVDKGWVGPRAWLWDRARASIAPNETWLFRHPQIGPASPQDLTFPAYPPQLGPQDGSARIAPEAGGPPAPNSPLNRVSPLAAQRLAALLACRLPTRAEWLAAWTLYEQGRGASAADPTGAALWNVRDRTFALQRDHVARVTREILSREGLSNFRFPDDDVLMEDDAPARADAGVRPLDDRSLWFEAVDAPRGGHLRHLVGNVAEIVEDTDGENRPATWLIGASALSPPSRAADEPIPVIGRRRRFGFPDTGFRLAFSVEGRIKRPLSWKLERLLREPGYAVATPTPAIAQPARPADYSGPPAGDSSDVDAPAPPTPEPAVFNDR